MYCCMTFPGISILKIETRVWEILHFGKWITLSSTVPLYGAFALVGVREWLALENGIGDIVCILAVLELLGENAKGTRRRVGWGRDA